jgi:polycystin 1L2
MQCGKTIKLTSKRRSDADNSHLFLRYEVVPQSGTGTKLGQLLVLNTETVVIGIMSMLIAFPITLFISFFFRKARKRILRPNRINEALNTASAEGKEIEDQGDTLSRPSTAKGNMYDFLDKEPLSRHANPKFSIPWFFVIVGWVLCLASVVLPLAFLLVYTINNGVERTHHWLTSVVISFFFGMLVLDPLHVLMVALCRAVVCRDIDLDDDNVDEDEENTVVADEALCHRNPRSNPEFEPIDEDSLDRIRRVRKQEVEIWSVLQECSVYLFFMIAIVIVSYGNTDSIAFTFQNGIKNNIIRDAKFGQIRTANDWWDWAHSSLVDQLRAQRHYNGAPPLGLKGYIGDKTNRIMGYAMLRQVRVRPNTCRLDKLVLNLTMECAQKSDVVNEDASDFCDAWDERTPLTEELPSCQRPEFRYTTGEELQSLGYSASVDSYGGGGYVYRLNKASKTLRKNLVDLQAQHWINNHTRAIFLEFSVYNPNVSMTIKGILKDKSPKCITLQVNLFAICTIIAEFIPGGGIRPYHRIDIVRLLYNQSFSGNLTTACEFVVACFVVYFVIEQMGHARVRGRNHFQTYWVLADVALFALTFAAGLFHYMRHAETEKILDEFQRTNGNGYMNLKYVGLMNEFYGCTISLLLFVATIKFIKLLRFNNRFEILFSTLRFCCEDLAGFIAVFLLVFSGYVMMFYMLLHNHNYEFHTLLAAFETCFTMVLNRFKIGNIRETSQVAAVMFVFFAVSCTFILVNVLLTIIMESFDRVISILNNSVWTYS